MDNYIFLTDEGYTFQPHLKSDIPDIENLQVIGFASGENVDEAYENLLATHVYLNETTFENVFCYKLDANYEKTRKDFCLRI